MFLSISSYKLPYIIQYTLFLVKSKHHEEANLHMRKRIYKRNGHIEDY